VIYSASDLAAAARCEYALLRSFDAKLGRGPAVTTEDELLARTATLGGTSTNSGTARTSRSSAARNTRSTG
jgi:predicted RecB family nuclease